MVPTNGYSDINHSVSYRGDSPLYVMNSYQTLVQGLHRNLYGDKNYVPSDTVKQMEATIYERFGSIEESKER